jgi:hypothetical protein
VGNSDLGPDGPGAGIVLCVFCPSSSSSSWVILGLIHSRRWSGALGLGLVVVAFFSVEVGRPTKVFQATTGLGDMASSEN